MPHNALLQTDLPQVNVRRGKVRDVYDLGDALLIVASDRISAFDWVLPTGIPDKGRVLTQLSLFWFDLLKVPNHLITGDVMQMHLPFDANGHDLVGRSMLVRKARVVPIECVVRGYLAGSGWKEYCRDATVCGIPLPAGLTENARLPEPIFTPATKEDHGHDINISFTQMTDSIGTTTAEQLRRGSLDVYRRAAEYAAQRGVIIADTKFEWGWYLDELIVIDEVLTPDSSRFWPADDYTAGRSQPSFDKQFVRDWLESVKIDGHPWDKTPPAPRLPKEVIEKTAAKYREALQRLSA